MGLLIFLLLLGGAYYLFKRSGMWDEMASVQEARQRAARRAYQLPPMAPPQRLERRPYPKRAPGTPLVHRETLLASLPWLAAGIGFLIFVGLVAQSLIPVALMAAPLAVAGLLAIRYRERALREIDSELASVLSGEELYVPEDWQ